MLRHISLSFPGAGDTGQAAVFASSIRSAAIASAAIDCRSPALRRTSGSLFNFRDSQRTYGSDPRAGNLSIFNAMRTLLRVGVFVCCLGMLCRVQATSDKGVMKIVLLGTGTPYPGSDRFGSAIFIEAGGEKLLFDCGRGAVIRLSEAGVNVNEIDRVFLTHLHSDHIVGLPDLWLTGWLLGRRTALQVWGPPGTSNLTKGLAEAFRFDVETRESTQQLPSTGAEIMAHEIQQGDIYNKGDIKVTAFVVDHGPVKPAFGYRVDYSGHSVVTSGDTRFSENLIHFAKGTDCLIHSAWSISSENPTPPALRSIASAEEAAQVFSMTQPRLAVINHYKNPAGMREAIRAGYKGQFIIGKDLMTIHVGNVVTWEER